MKTCDEILAMLEKDIWDGGDYSVPLAAQKLIVELLLDIRETLTGIDWNVDQIDERHRS